MEQDAAAITPTSSTQAFGIPLSTLVQRAGTDADGLMIPAFLSHVGDTVHANIGAMGLFRVNGSAARMRQIQHDMDAGQAIGGSVHDQTGLLKAFLRALPDPLFTFRLYSPFIVAFKIADQEKRLEAILMLCLLLPEAHLHTLAYLMRLLSAVANEASNQMTATTLASILTPNLLRPPVERGAVTSERELADHASCVGVVELLINHAADIGGVPVEVVRQASEMADPNRAKQLYDRQINGRTKWWSRGYQPRKGSRQTNAVSVQTLNLLKQSEKAVKEQHTPTAQRKRATTGGAPTAPILYSQVLSVSANGRCGGDGSGPQASAET